MMNDLTMERIGQLAGVSRSTVSRVINNNQQVNPNLRQRVLEVIAETDFRPNLTARSLVSRRTNVIGLVIPRQVKSLFIDPFFPGLIHGITQACNAQQYTLALYLCHTKTEEEMLYQRVLNGSTVDGVIISSPQLNDPLLSTLNKNKRAFVTIGSPGEAIEASFVGVDNISSTQMAVNHLLQLDRKRIATITGPLNTPVGRERQQGYRNAMIARGISIDPDLIVEGDFTELGGYMKMQQLLAHNPDAVFAASDMMAFGALRALNDAGLRVPQDVAVIGFDDMDLPTQATLALTTVRQPIQKIGSLAVETLLDIIANGANPVRRLVLPTQLIIRQTCGMNYKH